MADKIPVDTLYYATIVTRDAAALHYQDTRQKLGHVIEIHPPASPNPAWRRLGAGLHV